jgi:hypothetical protein
MVEIIMAIVVLAFGILVLSSSAAGFSRMLGSGQGKTRAAAVASARVEYLRNLAMGTMPPCTSASLTGGTAVQPAGFTETWTVSGTGAIRTVKVIVTYRTGSRAQADTLGAVLSC